MIGVKFLQNVVQTVIGVCEWRSLCIVGSNMNFRVLSLATGIGSFVVSIFWLFCIISGSNADGIRSAAFIEIQRDLSMGMGGMGGMGMGMGMNPMMMGGMGMGMGMNPMMGGMMMTPSFKMTMALRAWCIYQYKSGMGMPTPLWGDLGDLPSYEIKQEDGYVIQCVRPWVALNDQRIVMSIAQVIGLQNPMLYMGGQGGSSFLLDRASAMYSFIEALYYFMIVFSLIVTIVAITAVPMRRRILPILSASCACLVLIPAIIAFSLWTFVYSQFCSYVDVGNMWNNDVWVRPGSSYWLTVVGTILAFIVAILAILSFFEMRKESTSKHQKTVVP